MSLIYLQAIKARIASLVCSSSNVVSSTSVSTSLNSRQEDIKACVLNTGFYSVLYMTSADWPAAETHRRPQPAAQPVKGKLCLIQPLTLFVQRIPGALATTYEIPFPPVSRCSAVCSSAVRSLSISLQVSRFSLSLLSFRWGDRGVRVEPTPTVRCVCVCVRVTRE